MAHAILRLPAVKAASGLSRSTIYARIEQGLWPRPIKLGLRAVGWEAACVEALNAARIASKDDASIRMLVAKLESARKSVA